MPGLNIYLSPIVNYMCATMPKPGARSFDAEGRMHIAGRSTCTSRKAFSRLAITA
jgi:hypothetical protein